MNPNGKIRIFYLIDKLDYGGAEYHLLNVIRHLNYGLFEPFVGCLKNRNGIGELIAELGIPVYEFGIDQIYCSRAWRQGHRLRSLLLHHRIQILQTYLNSANVFGPFQSLFLPGQLRVIISRRDDGFGLSSRLALLQRWLAASHVDRIITVSEHIRRLTIDQWRLPPGKIVTIHNGVALPNAGEIAMRAQFLVEWHLPPSAKIIGYVGRLDPVKGLDLFFSTIPFVLSHFPDTFFFIIGKGCLEESLRRQVERLGIAGRVIFTGHQIDLCRFYQAMDVLVNTSHTEGISNSILEAMSYGKVVVATAVGGTPEIIEHGRSGLLYYSRDPEILAGLIIQLLLQPSWMQELGGTARQRMQQQFSLVRMMKKLQAQYLDLVAKKESLGVLEQ